MLIWCCLRQLPLYGNPYPPKDVILNEEPGTLESGIRTAREAATPYFSIATAASQRGTTFLATAVAHTRSLYERISDDSSSVPKAAAITAGGLTGLLIASRKGFIRKILYTSIGLTAAAAACYPNQSRELIDLSAYIARRRGPDLIKEILGIDVAPYLDLKKLDRIETTPPAGDGGGQQSPIVDSSAK